MGNFNGCFKHIGLRNLLRNFLKKKKEKEKTINFFLQLFYLPIKWCKQRILSALNLHARPQKFQKYYLFSTRPRKHLDWRGATRSGIRTLEVHFQVKLTKMPLVNPGLTESQSRSKLSQNNIFHVSTFYIKSKLLGDFRQFWPSLTRGWLLGALETLILIQI